MSKKTFKSVATTFFSSATQEKQTPQQSKAGKSAKEVQRKGQPKANPTAQPAALETKVRRVQLLLKPSTYEIAKEAAYQKRLSLNEYIHLLIEENNK